MDGQKKRYSKFNEKHNKINIKRKKTMSIRAKMVLVITVSITIPMILSFYRSNEILSNNIETNFRDKAFVSLQRVNELVLDYQKKVLDHGEMLATSYELKQSLLEGDSLKASQFLIPLVSSLGIDRLSVITPDRFLLTQTDEPSKAGSLVEDTHLIKSGFSGFKTHQMVSDSEGIKISGVMPIREHHSSTGDLIGVLILEYQLDQRFLTNIRDMYGMEATLYIENEILTTFHEGNEGELDIDTSLKDIDDALVFYEKKDLQDKQYNFAYISLRNNKNEEIAVLSLAMPMDELLSAKTALSSQLILISILGLAIGSLYGILTSNGMVIQIKQLVKDAKIIGDGNLSYTATVLKQNELGLLTEEFNAMSQALKETVTSIHTTVAASMDSSANLTGCVEASKVITDRVLEASTEINNHSIKQLYDATEATKQIEDNVSRTQAVAKQTQVIKDKTSQISHSVTKSQELLGNLVQTSSKGQETILRTKNQIYGFKQELDAIKKVTVLITDISAQTKLLALNAAIEANRAGEAGNGFMVVAKEITKLSQGANDAVKEINQLIKNLDTEMDLTRNLVEDSTNEMEETFVAVENVDVYFHTIAAHITGIDELIHTIWFDSKKQEAEIENIKNRFSESKRISEVTREYTKELADIAATQAHELEQISQGIKQLTDVINMTGEFAYKFNI